MDNFVKFHNITPQKVNLIEDSRGYFYNLYNYEDCGSVFKQDSFSFSKKGVLRGLHFQSGRFNQEKLIYVLDGHICDVIVDIHKNSETFGKWSKIELKTGEYMVIPKFFAHGFYALSDTKLMYKFSETWNKESEKTLKWDDPTVGINWRLDKNPILSDKDKNGLSINHIYENFDSWW